MPTTHPPVLAVRPDEHPTITCPDWCTCSYEDHLDELGTLEGFVVHHSKGGPVSHSRLAYPDNSLGDEPPQIYIEVPCGITIEVARELVVLLSTAIDEASR